MGRRLRRALLGLGILGAGIEGAHLATKEKDQSAAAVPNNGVRDVGLPDAGNDARVHKRLSEWERRMKDQKKIQQIREDVGLDPKDQPIFSVYNMDDKEPATKEWFVTEQDVGKLQNVFSKLSDFTWNNDSTGFVQVHMMNDGKKGRRLCSIEILKDGTYLLKAAFAYDMDIPVAIIGDLDQLADVIPMMKMEYDNYVSGAERFQDEEKRKIELHLRNHPSPE